MMEDIEDDTSIEVEANLVFSQEMTLRAVAGAIFAAVVDVFECQEPYTLVFIVTMLDGHSQRMDVHKDDLSLELRRWLDGMSS
jgi:hypothetical protein